MQEPCKNCSYRETKRSGKIHEKNARKWPTSKDYASSAFPRERLPQENNSKSASPRQRSSFRKYCPANMSSLSKVLGRIVPRPRPRYISSSRERCHVSTVSQFENNATSHNSKNKFLATLSEISFLREQCHVSTSLRNKTSRD